MSVELNTLIDSELLKTTTGGLSSVRTLKYNGAELEWTEDTQEAYVGLLSTGSESIVVTANTAEDFTTATLWSTTANKNTTVDLSAGTVTLNSSGIYKISSWSSLSSDTANSLLTIRYTVNGIPSSTSLKGLSKDIGDTNNLSASGLFTLTSGDVVGLTIESDKACTLTIQDCGLTLHKIDGV